MGIIRAGPAHRCANVGSALCSHGIGNVVVGGVTVTNALRGGGGIHHGLTTRPRRGRARGVDPRTHEREEDGTQRDSWGVTTYPKYP